MLPLHFLIMRHPRLAFRGVETEVTRFLEARLTEAGATWRFISRDEAHVAVITCILEAKGRYIVLHDIMNPIVDFELVREMVKRLEFSNAVTALCDGAIPGTQVECVLSPLAKGLPDRLTANEDIIVVRWFTQDIHNNQFNLYKYKRLKMFLFLLRNLKRMETMDVETFVSALSREDIFPGLVAFGEKSELVNYAQCPHCYGAVTSLPMRMSQPFCGYIPNSRPLYHECQSCGLVILSPAVQGRCTHNIYDAYDKQDFVVTHNNNYHANAARCDFKLFIDNLADNTSTLDIGGGMGGFSMFLKENHPSWDVTHSDFAIKQNTHLEDLGIKTRSINVIEEAIGHNCYNLITAWEVLEHVPYENLSFLLDNIFEALSPGGYFVFSTPDFDSPLCRSMDFFAACPPFHYLVFGQQWLRRYFAADPRWELLPMRSCSDFLDDAIQWYEYAERTCPSFQLRATSAVMKAIFSLEQADLLREGLLSQGIGTEVVVTLRKRIGMA